MQLLQIKIRVSIYLKRTKSSEVPFWAFGSDYDKKRITHLIARSNTGLTHLKFCWNSSPNPRQTNLWQFLPRKCWFLNILFHSVYDACRLFYAYSLKIIKNVLKMIIWPFQKPPMSASNWPIYGVKLILERGPRENRQTL